MWMKSRLLTSFETGGGHEREAKRRRRRREGHGERERGNRRGGEDGDGDGKREGEGGFFTKDQVMQMWWGGEAEFEYEHARYWPVLVRMCEERRTHMRKRWEELGAKVGVSEWDMKSGWTQVEVPAPPLDTMPSQDVSTEE